MPTTRAETAPEPETIEAAAARLTEMEAKHAAAVRKAAELAAEREEIALDAHSGAPRMRAKLDSVNLQVATQASEIESLAAAIRAAKAKLAAAEAREADADRRKRASAARDITARFADHAAKLDRAVADLLAAEAQFLDDVAAINRLGIAWPSLAVAQSGTRRALASALMGTKFQFEPIPPGQRHTFTELLSSWAGNAQHRAGAAEAA